MSKAKLVEESEIIVLEPKNMGEFTDAIFRVPASSVFSILYPAKNIIPQPSGLVFHFLVYSKGSGSLEVVLGNIKNSI